jgi:DNA-binding MurR/RpiR family transcriptional regulator
VKPYLKALLRQGRSLSPRKAPAKRSSLEEKARKLPEADVEDRPFAKLKQRQDYPHEAAAISVSESTLSRTIRSMGFGRKKDAGCE